MRKRLRLEKALLRRSDALEGSYEEALKKIRQRFGIPLPGSKSLAIHGVDEKQL